MGLKKSVEAKMVSEDECGLQGGSKNMVSMEGLNMICRYGAILPAPLHTANSNP